MRGFLFSLDALIAAGLLLLLAVFITGFSFEISSDELEAKRAFYTAKDINTIMLDGKLVNLKNSTLINNLLENESISESDLNRTFIDVIGHLWSVGNLTQASELAEAVIDPLINESVFGYELLFDDTTIHSREKPQQRFLVTTSTVISGIELGEEPEGFVSSAFARGIVRNTTMIFPMNPQGVACKPVVLGGKDGIFTKKFYLNSSEILEIENATLYISIHYAASSRSDQKIFLNGVHLVDGDISWIHDEEVTTGRVAFGVINVKSGIVLGWNELEFQAKGTTTSNVRVHPGFRLEMDVKENVTSLFVPNTEDKNYYFDNSYSNGGFGDISGVWQVLPFSIPKNADDLEVFLYLNANDTNNISKDNIPLDDEMSYNIHVYLNNKIIARVNPPSQNENTEVDVQLVYNITGNVTEGVNVLTVFLNMYGDQMWGKRTTRLYSDLENNPTDSSRVSVQYIKPPADVRTGQVLIGSRELLSGSEENPKTYNKSFNGTVGANLFKAHFYLGMNNMKNSSITLTTGAEYTVFNSSRFLDTPTHLTLETSVLNLNGDNIFEFSDSCDEVDNCDFLPESTLEYFVWTPTLVGYGNVFSNSSAAIDDALERLENLFEGKASISGFSNDTQSVPRVPTMWGPAKMEVRVWV